MARTTKLPAKVKPTTTTTTTTTSSTEESEHVDAVVGGDDLPEDDDVAQDESKKRKSVTTTKVTTKKTKKDDDAAEDQQEDDGEEEIEATTTTTTTTTESFDEPAKKENQVKIISWNVAGFNACLKKGFKEYVESENADIYCLQETKIEADKVPKSAIPNGYEYHFHQADKKGHHGTALLTKVKPISVTKGIGIQKHDEEGRVITAEYEKFYLVNSYIPNSGVDRKEPLKRLDYRTKEWDVDFHNYMRELNKKKPVVWCGDLNVAHKEIDLKNPKTNQRTAGFTIEERNSFTSFLESGFVDTYRHFNPKKEAYTFWSYMFNARAKNAGWRLDYFIVSAAFLGSVAHSFIRPNVKGSDHCPIGVIIDN
eukprot:gene6734-7827_t